MKISTILSFIIIILLICGCSYSKDTTVLPGPDAPDAITSVCDSGTSPASRWIWGLWRVDISDDHKSADIVPMRTAGMHFNLVRLLEVAPCNHCLTIENIVTSSTGDLAVDIRIMHPFPGLDKYTGFDVRGIFIPGADYYFPENDAYVSIGADCPSMTWCDGYTRLFNPTEFPEGEAPFPILGYIKGKFAMGEDITSVLNPFLAFRRDAERRLFECGAAETLTYMIQADPGPLSFGYAVDASWHPTDEWHDPVNDFPLEANCMEAYRIDVHVGSGLDDGPAAYAPVDVVVYDHQGQNTISSVHIESPELFNGLVEMEYDHALTDESFLYTGHIQNLKAVEEGIVPTLVSVEDNYIDPNLGPISAYQLTKVPVGDIEGWVHTWGGTENDDGRRIAVDSHNNIIVTGLFYGAVDFDDGPELVERVSNGDRDAFVCKYTQEGELLWAITYGGTGDDRGHAIAVDQNDNILIAGIFMHTVDFDPGPGQFNMTSKGMFDPYVAKFSPDGEFLWASSWGGSGEDRGRGVACDPMGNVYVCGYFRDTADLLPGPGTNYIESEGMTDAYMMKFDQDGVYQWVRYWGDDGQDLLNGIQVYGADAIYAIGHASETIDLDPGAGEDIWVSNGGFDVTLQKFTLDGEYVWGRMWGGPEGTVAFGPDTSWGCSVDSEGSVYVAGWFKGEADFDPGPAQVLITADGDGDAFLSRINVDGDFEWARTWGGPGYDRGKRVAVAPDDSVSVVSRIESTLDLDPGPGEIIFTSPGSPDFAISRFDTDGNLIWAVPIGGTGNDIGSGIAIDGDGYIYTTGWAADLVDFCPGNGEAYMVSNGAGDVYLLKLTPEGTW